MSSIQQIRAVEREIRANKDLLEREQSALNESLGKRSKLDYQIKNSLRERAEKISRLNSKINGLDAVIKKTEHEIQQEKNSISARITATGLEANKKSEMRSRINSEILTIEREMKDKFGTLDLPSSSYVKSFLIGFSVLCVLVFFLALLFGKSISSINPSIIIIIGGFIGFVFMVSHHERFNTLDSKLRRLKDDVSNIILIPPMPEPSSHLQNLQKKLNDFQDEKNRVSHEVYYAESEQSDPEKEAQTLETKTNEHKKNIDRYLQIEKSLIIKKSDLEQDRQDIQDEKEEEFMDKLMQKVRERKALLNVDLEGMKDSLMNQAQVDHYKLRLIDEMQRKLRDQKFSDVDAIIQQMKALGLGS